MTEIAIGLEEIQAAGDLLYGNVEYLPGKREPIILRTPLLFAETLSKAFGCRVWLKLESLQKTGSYKLRGAFNNLAHLDPDVRARGVVTASAGNHAQGVAYAAETYGIAAKSTIFVPRGTPAVKIENTKSYGVEVEEIGATFDQAREAAYLAARESDRVFVEPFDDWQTIAGQGTIGIEIIEDLPQTDAIIVPVGGGGMIAGIAIAAHELAPEAAVIGAQATGADSMIRSLGARALTALPGLPETEIADGIKVREPGLRPFLVANELMPPDSFVRVRDQETIAAVADLLIMSKIVAEGAGAIGIAALRVIQEGRAETIAPFAADANVVVVISGANIDPSFTWRILYERSVPSLITVRVPISDRPGELLRLLEPIQAMKVNIIDVDVNRHDARPRMGERVVELCLAVNSSAEEQALLAGLETAGFAPQYSTWHDPA